MATDIPAGTFSFKIEKVGAYVGRQYVHGGTCPADKLRMFSRKSQPQCHVLRWMQIYNMIDIMSAYRWAALPCLHLELGLCI